MPPPSPFMTVQLPAAGQRLSLGSVPGSGDAFLIARLAASAAPARTVVVLCADAASSQRLADEIPFFAPDLRVHQLPDWETLPYDQFSPHQDLVSERLATLHHVSRRECDVLIAAVSTASYRLAPPSHLAGYTFFFRQGERLDEGRLRAQLALAGYQHVTQVMSPGEFSVRGGLIDLFPMGSVMPYRLDLLGDEIESIRTFNIDSQRSLYPSRTSACCRAASSRWTRTRAPRSAAAGARRSKATRQSPPSIATSATASRAPASNTSCRCSSTRPRRCSTTSATTRRSCSSATRATRCSASVATPSSAIASSPPTRRAPPCRRTACSCRSTTSFGAPARSGA